MSDTGKDPIDKSGCMEAIALLVTGACLGVIFGSVLVGVSGNTRGDVEREAVKAGVAEYIADAEGKPKFTWKTKPEK